MSIEPTGNHRLRRRTPALGALAAGALVLQALATSQAAQAAPARPAAAPVGTVAVTVNATAGLGTIPSNAIGLNTAVYDSYGRDAHRHE